MKVIKDTVRMGVILIYILLSQPLIAMAQTPGSTGGTSTTGGSSTSQPTQRQINAAASANARQRFNPNATLNMNGNTFGGITFSGVGGAIASCANVGGYLNGIIGKGFDKASSSINNLFKSSPQARESGGGIAGQAKEAAKAAGDILGGGAVPVDDPGVDQNNVQLKQANQRENCLNGVAYAVAKNMLRQVTEKTLSWVNTGFDGNPLYVRNLDSYLKTVRDQNIARYLSFIPQREPVFGNAIRSIFTEQVTGLSDGLLEKSMDTPQGRAYQRFQKDFTNGGWPALLNPNNNPIGAILESADELNSKIANDNENVRAELERNNGFLDLKKCVEYADTIDRLGTGSKECVRWETVTPGSVISAQINTVTTSPVRQLEQADQINEVIGSFFDQLLNKLFSKGLASLSRKSVSSGLGGAGANIVIGPNGQPIASASAEGLLGYNVGSSGIDTNDLDISRPQQLRAILQAQYDYLSYALDARAAMNRIVPTLGALDYCVPGPNPTWQDGLQDNMNTYFSSLQEVKKDSSFARKLLQTLSPFFNLLTGGGNPKPDAIAAADIQLYDKAINSMILISDTAYREPKQPTDRTYNHVRQRFDEVINAYKTTYTKENIKNAFISVDPTNAAYVSGFVDTAFIETSKLPQYDQAIAELDTEYSTAEQEVRSAIAELESIRTEVNSIVATARARYIAEQAAAGTPVNLACLDAAYMIDQSPIVPATRQESDAPSPFLQQSIQGTNYFYSNL